MTRGLFVSKATQRAIAKSVFRSEQEKKAKAMRADEMLKVEELHDEAEAFRGKLAEQCGQTLVARAEVERLRALLREAKQYVGDAGCDEDPETQTHANDLFERIAAALEPKP